MVFRDFIMDFHRSAQKAADPRKTHIGLIVSVLAVGYAGCGGEAPQEKTPEEICCSCLVDNRCTPASGSQCDNFFYKRDEGASIPVDIECVQMNKCYSPCDEAGLIFTSQ